MVGYEVDLKTLVAGHLDDRSQMVEQVNLLSHSLRAWPQLAAFG